MNSHPMQMVTARLISAQETWPLRHKVLKPDLPFSECEVPGDRLASTFHWGLFLKSELVSVATFVEETHPNFSSQKSYRLRGMATLVHQQKSGGGSRLMTAATDHLVSQGVDFLWCNARVKAFGFYGKMGFQYFGGMFDIPQIGPHKVMYKVLIPR